MIRYFKPTLYLLILILNISFSFGQGKTGAELTIREKFLNYCKEVPREEIYVQTDREEFIAGEDIWFSIYLFDRQTNTPSGKSEIVYFELLNPDNMPIIRKRIRIENGSGPGQIVLPDSVSSGKYTIRAYTNWMKNFLPYNCFTQKINIYNALSTKSFKEKPNSEKTGTDKFSPVSYPGVSLSINNSGSESVDISINTSSDFRTGNANSGYLFIQTHGNINYDGQVSFQGDNTKIDLLKRLFSPGINQIVVFDSKGNPVAEKYIYTPVKSEENMTLNVPESSGKRSKVDAGIILDRQFLSSGNYVRLSVSVVPETDYHYVHDITDYMIFGSEFGVVPDELRAKNLNDLSPQVVDNWLSKVASNWIDWKQIVKGEIPDMKYKMEKGEHYIYGRLVNSTSQLPQPDEYLFLSSPGKIAGLQYARTDSKGNFSFRIPASETVKDIIIQPEIVNKGNVVKLESSFSEEYPGIAKRQDSTAKVIPAYISKWSVNYQVSKIFGISYRWEPVLKPEPVKEPVRFYGKPDIGLIMDDYIKLPVMSEVFFELLPGTFLKNKKSVYDISILDPVDKRVYNSPPLLLVDGVVINDASLIAGLDPELVERIDVVKEKYFIGDYMFYGLVNVITRAANFSSVTLPDYAVRMQYRVFEPISTYISSEYSTKEKTDERVPDFRNSLYWNPSVIPDKDGKAEFDFWTSDVKSKYVINIQGISSDGKPVSLKKLIIVN